MINSDHEDNLLDLVDRYVHGLLDERDRVYVEQRAEASDVWAAALDEARRRKALIESVPGTEHSEDLIASTTGRIRDEGPGRQRRRRLAMGVAAFAAAAVVALFLGVNQYFATLSPSPFDLQVMGQRSLLSGSQGSLRVRLTDAADGSGVGARRVTLTLKNVESGDDVRLASFTTDSDGSGSPRFEIPDWPDGDYTLTASAETPSGTERIDHTVTLRRESRVILSTDKPVYQPGQTVRARVVALRRGTGRPLAGAPVVFEVSDPKGNLIHRERTVASAYGIASAECPLADLLNEGEYTLRCSVGASESVRSVRVERYTLPKFDATVELDRTFYTPDDTIRGSVAARYFFGEPVTDGTVAITASTTLAGERRVLARERVTIDGTGRADFRLRVPSRLFGTRTYDGDALIELAVLVTDAAGQEVERTLRSVVTTRPLRVHAVAEHGRPIPGTATRVFVFTTLADGQPVDARVAVEGLETELRTGPNGVAAFGLDDVGEDAVSLAMRAIDDSGRVARAALTLDPDRDERSFVLQTDALRYAAGGTMTVTAFGGGADPVFVDLVRDGQTILTDRIAIEDGRGDLAIDLPADISGALRLVGYRFDERGWPVRRDRVVVVRPADDLRVDVSATGGPFRPGGNAPLTIRVADASGAPKPGAVSLSIVDEAVFGVLPSASPMTLAMGSLEAELLEPIHAVYPWDPFAAEPKDPLVRDAVAALAAVGVVSGRDELMRRLLDEGYIDEFMLEALESDRLDELLEWMEGSLEPETIELLRGETDSVYTLRESSFPSKVREIDRAKKDWKKTRGAILAVAGAAAGFLFVFGLIYAIVRAAGFSASRVGEVLVVLVVIALLIGILMPALGKARQSARIMSDASSLRQLGMMIEMDGVPGVDAPVPGSAASTRVREWFPETLLWIPELVTDDDGVARVEVDLADSITNWKVSANAITASGELGGTTSDLTVFQPFFVDVNPPVALTRGDTIEFPVVLYNYLDEEQVVDLSVEPGGWYDMLDEPSKSVTIGAGSVRRVSFRLRASEIGRHTIRVDAEGSSPSGVVAADAIRKEVAVEPEGVPVLRSVNGTLKEPVSLEISFPPDAVEESEHASLKLYPSSFSQILEGLDGIFARPYGCFEQTSSTTYPNILALDYLRQTGVNAPEAEARALQYIHLGYQRLLSFEVAGGGFDWFGDPPANRTLTAYGLMEFEDMARVRDVDPALIERTRRWLLRQRNNDGSWDPEWHEMRDGPASQDPSQARLLTTAYIAWAALGRDGADPGEAAPTRRYLASVSPDAIDDPYTLSMVALALLKTGAEGDARPYLARLAETHEGDPRSAVWWERPPGGRTVFYGAGRSANVEATALALLAFMESGFEPRLARAGLDWLVGQRDTRGTWGTTQATVLALKALVSASSAPLGSGTERRIEVRQEGRLLREVVVPADQSDVMRLVDLSGMDAFRADRPVEVIDRTDAATGYQLALRHHRTAETAEPGGLTVSVEYGRAELRVGDLLPASAHVENTSGVTMPMVMLDLPIPPGFAPVTGDLEALVAGGSIARFELNPRSVIVYLRALAPGAPLELEYRLRATMPVEVTAPPPRAYEYYDPGVESTGDAVRLTVL